MINNNKKEDSRKFDPQRKASVEDVRDDQIIDIEIRLYDYSGNKIEPTLFYRNKFFFYIKRCSTWPGM